MEIYEHLKIPPSSIVRIALDTFLPKTKNNYFRYAGIMDVWNNTKF